MNSSVADRSAAAPALLVVGATGSIGRLVVEEALRARTPGSLDGVRDVPNMPLAEEPARVREDLRRKTERATASSAANAG